MDSPLLAVPWWETYWAPELQIGWAVTIFIMGLFIGSFLNVCIYRIPAGMSVNNPKRSFCFRCGTMIHWYDNLPIVSYLLLRGRCRACGSSYSARYMMVELLTGILFLSVFLAINPLGSESFQFGTFWYLAFTALLIVGTFTDLDHWIIPDEITLWGAGAALLAALGIGLIDTMPVLTTVGPFPVIRTEWGQDAFFMLQKLINGPERLGYTAEMMLWWEPFANALMGAIIGPAILYGIGFIGKLMFRKEAMGMGDVKLFALIGATLGVTGTLSTLFLACFFGAAAGLIGKAAGAMCPANTSILQGAPTRLAALGETESEPSGETLCEEEIATLETIGKIGESIPRPKSVHHLPFGPWIALGAIVTLIFHKSLQTAMIAWLF